MRPIAPALEAGRSSNGLRTEANPFRRGARGGWRVWRNTPQNEE